MAGSPIEPRGRSKNWSARGFRLLNPMAGKSVVDMLNNDPQGVNCRTAKKTVPVSVTGRTRRMAGKLAGNARLRLDQPRASDVFFWSYCFAALSCRPRHSVCSRTFPMFLPVACPVAFWPPRARGGGHGYRIPPRGGRPNEHER